MNPWEIIGWLVLVFTIILFIYFGIGMICGCLICLMNFISKRIKHYQTRNIKPEKGQYWIQDDSTLEITKIYDNGQISIRSNMCVWNESQDDWNKRVKNRKLFLDLE